jgi:hypothetical protein
MVNNSMQGTFLQVAHLYEKIIFLEVNMRKNILFLFLFIVFTLISSELVYAEFLYPLDENNGVSSSFGEYRESHLHAGLDLRTCGRNGLPIHAIEDGVVYKIGVELKNYGFSMYIKHPGDYYSFFAHLQGFENKTLKLMDIVEKERKATGKRYPGDIMVEVPVKKGQIVAYSGESGVGFPHVHFEIWKGDRKPINPLIDVYNFADSAFPGISKIMMVPMEADSYVNASHEPLTISLAKDKSVYKTDRLPVLSGRVRILASMSDKINSYYPVGIYSFETVLDGKNLYKASFGGITYDNWKKVGFVYDKRYYISAKGPYKLYKQPGNDLVCAGYEDNAGIIDCSTLTDGEHEYTIKVSDVAGNMVTCKIKFKSLKKESLSTSALNVLTGGKSFRQNIIYLAPYDDFVIYYYKTSSDYALKLIDPEGNNQSLQPTRASNGILYGEYKYTSSKGGSYKFELDNNANKISEASIEIEPIPVKVPSTIPFDNGTISVPQDAVYEMIYFRAEKISKSVPFYFTQLSPVYCFEPLATPFGSKITLSFTYGNEVSQGDAKRAGVYLFYRKCGWWKYINSKVDTEAKKVSADVADLDIYGCFVDKAIPVISDLRPSNNKHTKDRYPRIFGRLDDRGSGIDYDSLEVMLDDKIVDVDCDADYANFTGKPDYALSSGKHILKVNVKDYAGNVAKEATSTFFVN